MFVTLRSEIQIILSCSSPAAGHYPIFLQFVIYEVFNIGCTFCRGRSEQIRKDLEFDPKFDGESEPIYDIFRIFCSTPFMERKSKSTDMCTYIRYTLQKIVVNDDQELRS